MSSIIVGGWEATKKLISIAIETIDPLFVPYRIKTASSSINISPQGVGSAIALSPANGNVTIDANTISLSATAASNFSSVGTLGLSSIGADLNISSVTTGNIVISSDGDIDVDSATSSTITMDGVEIDVSTTSTSLVTNIGTDATARAINFANAYGTTLVNIDSGTDGLSVNTPGLVDLNSSKASVDALVFKASGVAGGVTVLGGTSGIDTDSTGSINISSSKGDATAVVITSSSAAAGIDIDAVILTTMDAGTINISTGTGTTVNIGTA